jgi:hypothetical protein
VSFGGFIQANTQVIVIVGPFVDVTDGFTPETGITLGAADEAELLKHGSSTVVDISGATWAAVTSCDGYYALTLTTSHTDTEGLITVVVQDDSVCLPVKMTWQVIAQAAFASLITAKDAGFMDVNIKTIGRTDTQETEASNLESACSNYSATRGLAGTALPAAAADAAGGLPISDAGGLDLDAQIGTDIDAILVDTGTTLDGRIPAALVGGRIDASVGAMANNVVTAAAVATGAIDADAIADNAIDAGAIADGSLTAAKFADSFLTAAKIATDAITADKIAANAIGASELATDAIDEINATVDTALADIHLDHLLAVDYDPASKPGVSTALLNEIVENDGGVSRFTVNALENAPSGTGASAETIADAVWDELSTGHTDAGKAGARMWTDVAAILADTGTDGVVLANDAVSAAKLAADAGTEIGTAVWATAARTLTAATNITSTGGTTVPQTGDSYARIGAAGASLTAVPWNAAWDAEVQSEVADALDVAIPGSPTANSINQRVAAIDDLTQAGGSGDLAAILTDTGTTLDGRIPAALVSGRMSADVGSISGDATAADNLEAACDGNTYNVGGGAVVAASVTGAVGSVTGNVGGNVVGSVGSVTGAVGSVTGNVGGSVASVTGAVGSVTGNVGGSVASVTGAVGSVTGNVGGSVASVTGAVGSVTGNVGGNVVGSVGSIGSGGIAAASLTAAAIDAIIDEPIEGSITLRQALRVVLAALGGKLSGAGTTTITVRDANDTANRIVATVDADGNRSAVTLTVT